MKIKFKSHAANHIIKALENQLANVHTEKYQKEMSYLRRQKEITQQLTKILSRAKTVETLVELEKELMGTNRTTIDSKINIIHLLILQHQFKSVHL